MHIEMNRMWMDGAVGGCALIRGVGKLSGIHFIEDSSDLCKIFSTLYPQNGM